MPDNAASIGKLESSGAETNVAGRDVVHASGDNLLAEIHNVTRDTRDRVICLETGQEAINESMKKLLTEMQHEVRRLKRSDACQWFVIVVFCALTVATGFGLVWLMAKIFGA